MIASGDTSLIYVVEFVRFQRAPCGSFSSRFSLSEAIVGSKSVSIDERWLNRVENDRNYGRRVESDLDRPERG